jgi:hypothetical protein
MNLGPETEVQNCRDRTSRREECYATPAYAGGKEKIIIEMGKAGTTGTHGSATSAHRQIRSTNRKGESGGKELSRSSMKRWLKLLGASGIERQKTAKKPGSHKGMAGAFSENTDKSKLETGRMLKRRECAASSGTAVKYTPLRCSLSSIYQEEIPTGQNYFRFCAREGCCVRQ